MAPRRRRSQVDSDDDDTELAGFMNREPTPPPALPPSSDPPSSPSLGARRMGSDAGIDGEGSDNGAVAQRGDSNLKEYAKRLTKKLKTAQAKQVEDAADLPPQALMLLVLATQYETQNATERVINQTKSFEVTKDLKGNIHGIARLYCISTKIGSYGGPVPLRVLGDLVKKNRYGIPDGLESLPAEWKKIESEISYYLGQVRSKLKTRVKQSVENKLSLFELAKTLTVECGRPDLSPGVLARAALLRYIYLYKDGKNQGDGYWDAVDKKLKLMREKSGGDKLKLKNGYAGMIQKDEEQFGEKTEEQQEEMERGKRDDRQTEMDDVIDS